MLAYISKERCQIKIPAMSLFSERTEKGMIKWFRG